MDRPDVIIEDSLTGIGSDRYGDYLAHALCLGGRCAFQFNGQNFELHENDLMIVRKDKLIDDVRPSDDFAVRTLYVTAQFVELCTPQTNYGMKGQLSLFLNPIMGLDDRQRFVCERDFRWIAYRLEQTGHKFYRELLINAVQSAILDFSIFIRR